MSNSDRIEDLVDLGLDINYEIAGNCAKLDVKNLIISFNDCDGMEDNSLHPAICQGNMSWRFYLIISRFFVVFF